MDLNTENIPSQKGRIAIVTGANNGIGLETTLGLAKHGFKVIMACRNIEKGKQASASIQQQVPNADLHVLKLDLSDLESVKLFAKQFNDRFEKLDVLVNNAGVMTTSGQKNKEGMELQFATNHLGHFLLTSLLMDKIPNNTDSRIISLSSIAHRSAKIHFGDIECKNDKGFGAAYGQSKLACLMFADELHRKLSKANKKIHSMVVHPGVSDTGLFNEMSWIQVVLMKILAPFLTHSIEKAAVPSIYAALSVNVKSGDFLGPTGFYGMKGKLGLAQRSEYAKDEAIASDLWDLSEQLCGIKFTL